MTHFPQDIFEKILTHRSELMFEDEFKKHKDKINNWKTYENDYLNLLKKREVESIIDEDLLDNSVLLCSEPTPEKCHRRIAAEYIQSLFNGVEIFHL